MIDANKAAFGNGFTAERDMQIMQDIVTSARKLRQDMKLDPKLALNGTLYSRSDAHRVGIANAMAIQKLGNVTLAFRKQGKMLPAVRVVADRIQEMVRSWDDQLTQP